MPEQTPFASTQDDIDRIIDDWHDGHIDTPSLHEALGWTLGQYMSWVETTIIPQNTQTPTDQIDD